MNVPTYNELRESGNQPRVHGNGFLQLDLPDGRRLHVWDDMLPRQKVSSSIHDHAFGFKSTILCGNLTNVIYTLMPHPCGDYDVLTPQRREGTEDTKLAPTGERVVLREVYRYTYKKDWTYHMIPLVFHDTLYKGLTATIIEKTVRMDVEPRILIPHGESPDNEFDRTEFDPDDLWPFVKLAVTFGR